MNFYLSPLKLQVNTLNFQDSQILIEPPVDIYHLKSFLTTEKSVVQKKKKLNLITYHLKETIKLNLFERLL